jgi:hypothetical protein
MPAYNGIKVISSINESKRSERATTDGRPIDTVYATHRVIDTRICCAARKIEPMLAVKKIVTSKIHASSPSSRPLSIFERNIYMRGGENVRITGVKYIRETGFIRLVCLSGCAHTKYET